MLGWTTTLLRDISYAAYAIFNKISQEVRLKFAYKNVMIRSYTKIDVYHRLDEPPLPKYFCLGDHNKFCCIISLSYRNCLYDNCVYYDRNLAFFQK